MNHWRMCCCLLLTVMAVAALAAEASDTGALSDKGITVDPLTVAPKLVHQVWEA